MFVLGVLWARLPFAFCLLTSAFSFDADAGFARRGRGVGESELVELMQLAPEELLVRQRRLVFGDEGGGDGAGQGVFNDLVVLRGAKNDAAGGPFVGFAEVAVEGFQVELHFAKMLRLELRDLKIESHQALQRAMEEQEVEVEIPPTDLDAELFTGETKVRPEFDQELLEVGDEGLLGLP